MKENNILIEAESFKDFGGWRLDTQFIHIMGSPYLIAHGIGKAVASAKTTVKLPEAGKWFIWARTKNWIPGEWEAPGRFKIAVDGNELSHVFGEGSGEWNWECGGSVKIKNAEVSLSLIDLTGFDGRCDAIFLTKDENLIPDNSSEPMCEWRKRYGFAEELPEKSFDLVVVGGGIAGISAAISAGRSGIKTALIESREYLGGNASHETRVGPSGDFPPARYPNLGDIVKTLTIERPGGEETPEWFRECSETRLKIVEAEPNIELFLDHHVYDVEMEGPRITAVNIMETHGQSFQKIIGKFFCDSTGHGTLGLKAGADYNMEPGKRMGMSNQWYWNFKEEESPFPDIPWALPLTENGFPYPNDSGMEVTPGQRSKARKFKPIEKKGWGKWFWESGFDKHPLNDLEAIRDHNLRAAYSAWNAIKNHGAYSDLDPSGKSHANAELVWQVYVGGPRETLQILGDVIVTEDDIYSNREFPDGCVPATWGIDLHLPLPLYEKETPDNPFISRAHFDGWVDDTKGEWHDSPMPCVQGKMRNAYDRSVGYLFPYRSFYSRNIDNLFTAGRDISCTHEALGTVRVMNTLGMIGVVVGRAASIACKHDSTPRGVYKNHWDELDELLAKPGYYRKNC